MGKERNTNQNDNSLRKMLYISGAVLTIAIITFVIIFISYGNKVNSRANDSRLNTEMIADLVPSTTDQTQSASSNIGKTVEELEASTNKVEENAIEQKNETTKESTNTKKTQETKVETNESPQQSTQVADPEFIMPVEGEIMKEYAKDNLVYSTTLQEWTTHLGIDIVADKTTVVKASSEGKVKAIKNDPRYGITVVIEHVNGFISVYSNLLTAEFVVEGEVITKGQTIGTVGNTAVFEIADESHLHFEIWKDNVSVDPMLYLK